MESSKVDESFPTPPSFLLAGSRTWQNVSIEPIHSSHSSLPPPPIFTSPLTVPSTPSCTDRPKFVSYETELLRYPGLTTCISCQTQVTTVVTFQVGTYAWLMCLVFLLFGLVVGCCLIPFFVNHFKDACHSCPLCHRVLHVHKKACCE